MLNPNQIAVLHWHQANQTTQFAVGSIPTGLAFDGNNIWVTNGGSSNIMKLRASDGALLKTVTLSGNPAYDAFDGANIWVTIPNGNAVTKLRASDGTVLGNFTVGKLSPRSSLRWTQCVGR